jgi:hypothetical protein
MALAASCARIPASLAAFSAAYRTDRAFPAYAAPGDRSCRQSAFPTEEFANRLRAAAFGDCGQDLLYGVGRVAADDLRRSVTDVPAARDRFDGRWRPTG